MFIANALREIEQKRDEPPVIEFLLIHGGVNAVVMSPAIVFNRQCRHFGTRWNTRAVFRESRCNAWTFRRVIATPFKIDESALDVETCARHGIIIASKDRSVFFFYRYSDNKTLYARGKFIAQSEWMRVSFDFYLSFFFFTFSWNFSNRFDSFRPFDRSDVTGDYHAGIMSSDYHWSHRSVINTIRYE